MIRSSMPAVYLGLSLLSLCMSEYGYGQTPQTASAASTLSQIINDHDQRQAADLFEYLKQHVKQYPGQRADQSVPAEPVSANPQTMVNAATAAQPGLTVTPPSNQHAVTVSKVAKRQQTARHHHPSTIQLQQLTRQLQHSQQTIRSLKQQLQQQQSVMQQQQQSVVTARANQNDSVVLGQLWQALSQSWQQFRQQMVQQQHKLLTDQQVTALQQQLLAKQQQIARLQ